MEEYSSERYSRKISGRETRERKDGKISDIMRCDAAIFSLPFTMHYFTFLIASLIISLEG
jgi:hypothetical protein